MLDASVVTVALAGFIAAVSAFLAVRIATRATKQKIERHFSEQAQQLKREHREIVIDHQIQSRLHD